MHGIQQHNVMGMQGAGMGAASPQQPAMQQGMVPQNMQQQQQQQQAPQQQPQPQQQLTPHQQQLKHHLEMQRSDNFLKVRRLMEPLRESLSTSLKNAAQTLNCNHIADSGTQKPGDNLQSPPRFDKHLEEFYSICDQIELSLTTAIKCMQQNSKEQRYMPVPVTPTRVEPLPPSESAGTISYSQFLNNVRSHIGFSKEIQDTLLSAAQNISATDPPQI